MTSNADDMTWGDCEMLAKRRHNLHSGQNSHRPLSENYELVGIVAEAVVARALGLDMDLSDKPGGDGRVDFYTDAGTIDAKGAQKPKHLLREVGKPHADILVLVKVNIEKKTTRIVGWDYDTVMVRWPQATMPGYSVVNHVRPARALRPIDELASLVNASEKIENA